MFSDYELSEFSIRLKNIRNSLGYTRKFVSESIGINVDTLRKIENGYNIPRFDTLESLSHLYKTDLLQLLNNFKNNTTITYFYESINTYLINNNIDSLVNLYDEFLLWLKTNNNSLINQTELLQLKDYFSILKMKFTDEKYTYEQAIEKLTATIQITSPKFSLSSWKVKNLNVLELRILYCIASFLLQSNRYKLSCEILIYISNKIDFICSSKLEAQFMLVKIYALIAYDYHMLDEHVKALEFAEKGIGLCLNFNIMECLPLLLARKGVAMFHLGITGYNELLNQAVVLLEIQNNRNLANKYREINLKYGAD